MRRRAEERETARAAAADPELARRTRLGQVTLAAVRRYAPRRFEGRLALFLPSARWRDSWEALLCRRWRPLAAEVHELDGPGCRGDQLLAEPAVGVLAEQIRDYSVSSSRLHPSLIHKSTPFIHKATSVA
jgi:hypothetical protein